MSVTFESLTSDLALMLRDIISETEEDLNGDANAETVFRDLARRLILRLGESFALVPLDQPEWASCAPIIIKTNTQSAQDRSARRILNLLDIWLQRNKGAKYTTWVDNIGQCIVSTDVRPGQTVVFKGESVQEAYGQAACVIALDD